MGVGWGDVSGYTWVLYYHIGLMTMFDIHLISNKVTFDESKPQDIPGKTCDAILDHMYGGPSQVLTPKTVIFCHLSLLKSALALVAIQNPSDV